MQKPVSIHVADLNMHLRPRPQVHSVLCIVFCWETVGSMWLHPIKPAQVACNSAAFSVPSVYTLSLFKLQTHATELCRSPHRSWGQACVFPQKTFSVLQFLCETMMRVYIMWLLADITECHVLMSCMLGRRLFSQMNDSKEALFSTSGASHSRDKVVKEKSFSTTAGQWPFLLENQKQSEQSEIPKLVIHHFIKPSLACH